MHNKEHLLDLNYLPERVRFDVCNLCQLDCARCWIRETEEHIKQYNGGFGYVNFETFKKFIDDNSFVKEIEISHNGEIFLNPDLDKIIKYAYEKNVQLTAYMGTNLNYLKEETAENLVKYKFKGLTVSIDAASPETYVIYRRKGNFNTVINNIRLINSFKKKYNSEFPHLTYKFILFGHNEHEIEKAKELSEELDMHMDFVPNQVLDYSPVKNPERVKELTNVDTKETFLEIFYKNFKEKDSFFFCLDLFDQPQINWNGDFYGCCMMKDLNFGNIYNNGLEKTIHGEKVVYAKLMLTDLSIIPRQDIPCTYCFVYKFLKDNNLSLF